MRLVREVLAAGEDARGGTDLPGALRFLNGVQKRRAVVFLVSDFMNRGDSENLLRTTARHHDLVCVSVADPAESELPAAGLVELEDPETGFISLVDTSSARVRKAFAENAAAERSAVSKFFAKNAIDTMELSTDRPYIDEVRALFRRRAVRRGGRGAANV
jgi:uncharacterized protein (DUF58 family)